jgi:predicted nucleic acid-binding protein
MAILTDAGKRLFLDSSYAIAISVESDKHHLKAVALSEELERQQLKVITTRAVMLEIGSPLAKSNFRNTAVELLSGLEHDPAVEIIPLSESLYSQAFSLFRQRPDKTWSLVDCSSFVVMEERGMQKALTADTHFIQAGFQALLLQFE